MPDAVKTIVGGSFAPPLSDAKMAEYKAMIEELPVYSRLRDAAGKLYSCCAAWWELPEPNGTAKSKHRTGATITSMDPAHVTALWELVPWDDELDAIGLVLEGVSNETAKPLRDAAFHLLWHVKEFSLDREPLTADKL